MLFLQYISQVIHIEIIASITLNIYLHTRSKGEQRFECDCFDFLFPPSKRQLAPCFHHLIILYTGNNREEYSIVRETSSFESSRECIRIVQVCWVYINLPSMSCCFTLICVFFYVQYR